MCACEQREQSVKVLLKCVALRSGGGMGRGTVGKVRIHLPSIPSLAHHTLSLLNNSPSSTPFSRHVCFLSAVSPSPDHPCRGLQRVQTWLAQGSQGQRPFRRNGKRAIRAVSAISTVRPVNEGVVGLRACVLACWGRWTLRIARIAGARPEVRVCGGFP
ncbi:uncharacterized protein EI97DRAFT_56413 [Westerdykella ornata]|uniref:Uncharacterized protein n=1 Tax=Westerdykella ornata TaxID=318751 RepID=A0A6A6JHW5_WESOR|nr:uncharacterized protein EI97DRAFT_56413 [Westerdykella ornata]KAF2275815.1 hypothetical protein EI97DRAFT_56413 [Westerdykella ornata]